MKAALKRKPGVGIEYEPNAKKPIISDGEVLLRVRAVGICGSDAHIYQGHNIGNLPKLPVPFIPGHEFAGEIEEVGREVQGFVVGDRVCAEIAVTCGTCYFCKTDQRVYCLNIREIGVDRDGAFAEYATVPAYNLHRLPDSLSFEQGALVEPLSSALHPFERMEIGPEDTITILGAGPIGLYATAAARALGYGKIIVVGRHAKRLSLARELGADYVLDLDNANPVKEVLALTSGIGSDVVLEAAGNPSAVAQSLELARKDGQVCLVGATLDPVTISPQLIVGKALRVMGSFDYTWITFERAIGLIASGKVDAMKVVTHRFPLEKIGDAFAAVVSREAVKTVVVP